MPERLLEHISQALLPAPPDILGVAVSGGGDSVALLSVLRDFCNIHDISLHAVTVDHGLRAASAAEAREVATLCQALNVPHDILVWSEWDGTGNLQNEARKARYRKIADWAGRLGITTICVGHTADDQAETVLMRLARSSGVDGLSAMQTSTLRDGINWVRPLLAVRREKLRNYLRLRDMSWSEDPSNTDEQFARIKARRVLEVLAPLGIDTDILCDVADHMQRSRKALDWQTFLAAKKVITIEAGAVVLDEALFELQPDEIQRRLLVRAINWVSGSSYPPRKAALSNVKQALRNGQASTLEGCHIRRIGGNIWIFREHKAVSFVETEIDMPWDGRWVLKSDLSGKVSHSLRLRALGPSGLEQCPDWRATGRPYVVLQSTPAVWDGQQLVAAPLAGFPQYWRAELNLDEDTFFAALLSH
ncbi:tRNA(Ile)-lysidine synthase [Sulfitobacter noctilucae]|uniref:tRNA lysidine(34) synthetase TilS n=1 Tax=Sulfitobacter noctilucae TaxID=1342302 RepID=UPI000468AFD8|nr:tRNA lysidine(34) synthetase TilS [Sulfitobacter noctilucae]KIN60251.1 tRNA(Ile)-lysidine synthase [Sulfitobacter noctilucae]